MGRIWASKGLLALVLLVGCERGEVASPAPVSPATNAVEAVATKPLSPDGKAAVKMRAALDDGDVREALAGARRLMRSPERAVRSEALTVLAWIGKRALPELAEMMRDADDDLAQEAVTGWEQAFDELRYDFERSRHLLTAVSNLTDRAMLDAILMKTSELEDKSALPLLEEVILSCRGRLASTCAREMFRHVAGEPWSSTNRTAALVRILENR